MIERMNRTIQDMLSKYIKSNQKDWDLHLDYITLAYNSTPHESTSVSPHKMVFGREIKLPLDIMANNVVEEKTFETDFVRNLKDNLCQAHEFARKSLQKSSERQKQQYDLKVREKSYEDLPGVVVHGDNLKEYKGEKKIYWFNGRIQEESFPTELPNLDAFKDDEHLERNEIQPRNGKECTDAEPGPNADTELKSDSDAELGLGNDVELESESEAEVRSSRDTAIIVNKNATRFGRSLRKPERLY
ncbi:uncharacterized protein LOC134241774 [Saccostrea cucullata]|uniref:uncharacterized protein LOC134241774 n=1 Tax=Saccostrea cuccullata TaxID=36930 RepID=UPI002ED39D56